MVEAIAEQTNGVVAILPGTPAGIIKAEQLERIATIAKKGAGVVKLTSMQRMAILVNKDQVEDVKRQLAEVDLNVGVVGPEVWNPMGCPGKLCRYARQDALTDAMSIASLVGTKTPRPVKIGVSGCQNSCAWSKVVDIGLVGTKEGYDIYIGGDAGKNPRIGQKLTTVPKEEIINNIKGIVEKFNEFGESGEHIYNVIDREGIDLFL